MVVVSMPRSSAQLCRRGWCRFVQPGWFSDLSHELLDLSLPLAAFDGHLGAVLTVDIDCLDKDVPPSSLEARTAISLLDDIHTRVRRTKERDSLLNDLDWRQLALFTHSYHGLVSFALHFAGYDAAPEGSSGSGVFLARRI
jgi:hypothetical protein